MSSRATRRGDRIRTCDLPLPKRALYQAELRPESPTQLVDSPARACRKHASDGWTPESLLHTARASLCGHGRRRALWRARRLGSRAWQSVRMTDSPTTAPQDLRRWPSDPGSSSTRRSAPRASRPLTSASLLPCDLDLAVPAASELLAIGRRLHDEESNRQRVITQMRAAQAARSQSIVADRAESPCCVDRGVAVDLRRRRGTAGLAAPRSARAEPPASARMSPRPVTRRRCAARAGPQWPIGRAGAAAHARRGAHLDHRHRVPLRRIPRGEPRGALGDHRRGERARARGRVAAAGTTPARHRRGRRLRRDRAAVARCVDRARQRAVRHRRTRCRGLYGRRPARGRRGPGGHPSGERHPGDGVRCGLADSARRLPPRLQCCAGKRVRHRSVGRRARDLARRHRRALRAAHLRTDDCCRRRVRRRRARPHRGRFRDARPRLAPRVGVPRGHGRMGRGPLRRPPALGVGGDRLGSRRRTGFSA